MKVFKNISLKKYNTFGLGYKTKNLISISTLKEASSIFKGVITVKKPIQVLGSGSNVLFTEDFTGTIIHSGFKGIRIEAKDEKSVIISAGAGVEWDKLVEWCVDRGYSGLENLSLIPGTVGASPVQNIGAYGVEVKDLVEKVKAINIHNGLIRIFSNKECEFGYRTSIFKNRLKGKYLVVRVYYKLNVRHILNMQYGTLTDEVRKLGEETLQNIRKAVINIRSAKLPDPAITGNAGSFFKNPLVHEETAVRLKKEYPEMPLYDDPSGLKKLAAGWLIEKCGWKGKRLGDAGVHDKQALVIVNYGKATGKDIFDLSEAIKKSVLEKFEINLEREVEIIGTI
jgi:UDP-N-acetylmuramate dehydrogenase